MSLNSDIDKTITSAVNAKIEAAVLEALTSDGAVQSYVIATLNKPGKDRYGSADRKTTFLSQMLGGTIEELTKKVIAEEIQKHEKEIREEVSKALRKSLGVITDSLVSGFVENTKGNYPRIEVNFKSE